MFFLILIIPFTYLETNKTNIESLSNYDQIMNSSLDIFYTNQKSKERQMNELKKIKLIDNPIQTVLVQKEVKPITLMIYVKYYTPYIGINITSANINTNIYTNFSNQIVLTYITNDDLFNEKYDNMKTRVKNFSDLESLNTAILGIDNDSYILIAGNNITPFTKADNFTKNIFTNIFKFSWINSIASSSGSFILLLSKSANSYTKVNEKFTFDNNFININQNIMADPVFIETNGGAEFKKIATNAVFKPITEEPLINSKINIISPATANMDYALSFTSENNESFVYLSSRKLADEVVLYAKSPKNDVGPISTTYLDTQRPQFWSFEPVTKIVTSPLIVFIRTYSTPYFYLDVELENSVMVLKARRFKAALRQHWELIQQGTTGSIYKIRHLKSGMYLAYSDFDGYLYKNDGSVFLTKSENYTWNIKQILKNQINKNVIENFEPNRKNLFQGMEVPTDYGSVKNPSWKISGKVNGKNIVIESKGRTVWEESYGPIWNGKWIYYGTVASYKATLDINKVKFLIIKMDPNGNGIVEDEYFNFKMNVINAGSNILTGIIPSGQYKGYRATLKLIETDLKYMDPSKPFPVKMRYFIEKDLYTNNNNIPTVTGIATQYNSVGYGASTSDLWYSSWCSSNPDSVCNAEYRVIFSNGAVSDKIIESNSPSGLTNPDILFALSNVPQGINAILQGRKINTDKWYDVNVEPKTLSAGQKTVKFSGYTGNFKSTTSFFIKNIVYNLSSGDIYNMDGYSTKFLENTPILSNFLEASGIQTDSNLAFTPQTLQKIDTSIKEQTSTPYSIKKANNFMKNKIKSSKLLFKASTNGWNAQTFHQLCDNKGETITIATLEDGRFIGAYSPISWGYLNGQYISNPDTFLFDNDKKYTTSESIFGPGNYAIYQFSNYGPTFGGGFDFSTLSSQKTLTNNVFTYINNGKGPLGVNKQTYNNYQLKDLEVYSIST